jgi:hypothetical protein
MVDARRARALRVNYSITSSARATALDLRSHIGASRMKDRAEASGCPWSGIGARVRREA